jgi:DNA polymerase III epsilon subunit-like protein
MFNSKLAYDIPYGDAAFEKPAKFRKHYDIPHLMVGFDLETTGLSREEDEPISYGIAVYRNGIHQPNESHHFFAVPLSEIGDAASKVNGWTNEELERSHLNGTMLRDRNGDRHAPPLIQAAASNKAAQILAHYQKQGAVMIGANHIKTDNRPGFDIPMLKRVFKKYNNNLSLETSGFDPDKMKQVCVQQHEDAIDPQSSRAINKVNPRPRALSALAPHYGVTPGGHSALHDAVATVEIFKKQVDHNRKVAGLSPLDNTRTAGVVGETGIDYARASYCTGKDCNFCKHLDTVEESKKPTGEGKTMGNEEKSHVKIIKNIRKIHQKMGK